VRPVAIFRHSPIEGPGYLADFLEARGIPWRLVAIDAGEAVPEGPEAYSGLVFMGGPMSVNDDLPWLAPAFELVRQAVARDIPVLGHCLGGQLIARALGARVTRNPVKEIGWGEVGVLDNPTARAWFGGTQSFEAFHWHGETFALPEGAVRLLASPHCANQAYALGRHLGLQCHVEMTEAMIRAWCEHGAGEIAASDSPAVQSAEAILKLTPQRLPAMTAVAERLYSHWIGGLRHD